MQYTEDDLNALKEALLTGASSIRIGDRQVNFRTTAELKALIKEVQDSLEIDEGSTPVNVSNIKATWSKE